MHRSKNIIFLFILIPALLVSRLLWSQASGPQQLFDQANHWYYQHQYDSAIKNYQQLIDLGFQNSALFYNAGNAYYQTRQTGLSIYYLEKALQQDPGNPAIRRNLHLANQRVKDPIEISPPLLFELWWKEWLALQSLNAWVLSSLFFLWIWIFFLAFRIWTSSSSGWNRLACWIFGILFFLHFFGAIGRYYQVAHPDYAIVMIPDLEVRSAPDTDSPDLAQIHEGVKVVLLDLADGWEKVQLPNGIKGWVRKNTLRII